MERLPFEVGRVVQSRQGRDAGRYFVVLHVVDERFVMMADGLTRKISHPKKKKILHLHPKPIVVDCVAEKLPSHQLLDSDLRKALKEHGLQIDQPLCKEG
ncbi:MAG: KOW domain-containing RNA-binding protein [Christensenellaceae bacterium]|nr:KOW domain-containing RNA-binding protein [Christensenellaceae bacterium]